MAQQSKCRKKTEARREAILDAALEEFAAKGYAGARMEDIARGRQGHAVPAFWG